MSVLVFIDTNVLLYAYDPAESPRRAKAREKLNSLQDAQTGVISTQVLQEFYVNATRKLGYKPDVAKGLIRLLQNLQVVLITPSLIENAIDISRDSQISFWDALIIAAAASAGCLEVWTEDLNTGQRIQGIALVNPLAGS